MAIVTIYIGAAAAFFFGVAFYLIAFSVDQSSLLETPNIPVEKAIITSFASTTIHATADDVFTALTNFKESSEWSSFTNYTWKDAAADGVPRVGDNGKLELKIEGFSNRIMPFTITVLDREKRVIAEKSTGFPSWLLSSERVQEVIPVKGHNNLCEYRTWHTLQGVASYLLLLLAQEELMDAVRGTADRLKVFIEKR